MTVDQLRRAIANLPGNSIVAIATDDNEWPATAVTIDKSRAVRIINGTEISVGEKILWDDDLFNNE